MAEMILLLVEDDEGDQAVAESTAKRYNQERKRDIQLIKASSEQEAHKAINNNIDAAIIDLRLGGDAEAGVKLIEAIRNKWRIPVAVYSATPANIDNRDGLISVYKKGETEMTDVFDRLLEVFDTGITRIFGGRGIIEKEMDRVFWHAILPSVQTWAKYRKSGKSTEQAILRFTMSHLMEFLGEDVKSYFNEEMYISPPLKKPGIAVSRQLRTGSIVFSSDGNNLRFLVLSPACDLIPHQNGIKTDRILVVAIQDLDFHAIEKARKMCNTVVPEDSELAKRAQADREQGQNILHKICSNNYCQYMHFLPPTDKFVGGLVNFRRLEAYSPSDFDKKFAYPTFQIAPLFIKDVVSRFSSYYARQGQPDLDFDNLVEFLSQQNAK